MITILLRPVTYHGMTFQKKMDDFLVETPTSCLASAGLLAWTLLCAIQDSRQKRISNWLTLTAAALAGGFLLWQGHSLTGSAPAAVLAGLALALVLSLRLKRTRAAAVTGDAQARVS